MAVLSTINLPFVMEDKKHKRELYTEFVMVDIPFAYNIILDRLVLNCHEIVINISALCLKFPTPRGLAIIRGNHKSTQEYYIISMKSLGKAMMPINLLEKIDSYTKPEPTDSIKEVLLEADKKVRFGTVLSNIVKDNLVKLLNAK